MYIVSNESKDSLESAAETKIDLEKMIEHRNSTILDLENKLMQGIYHSGSW